MTISTFHALLIELGDITPHLDKISEKYFTLKPDVAYRLASKQSLPIPAFKLGDKKSKWMVNLKDLADYIDKQHEEATKEWQKMNG